MLGGIFFYVVVLSACWLCSWLAVFMRGQNTDRRMFPLGLVRAHRVYATIRKGIPFMRVHDAGCCGNPGICLIHAQGQKSLKGLPRATHCTGRAQTSSNVTPTVKLCPPPLTFRTKVRARRDVSAKKKKMTTIFRAENYLFFRRKISPISAAYMVEHVGHLGPIALNVLRMHSRCT